MEVLTKEFLFSIIVLIVLAILLGLDKVSQENFFKVLFLLIGSILGITYGYFKGVRVK